MHVRMYIVFPNCQLRGHTGQKSDNCFFESVIPLCVCKAVLSHHIVVIPRCKLCEHITTPVARVQVVTAATIAALPQHCCYHAAGTAYLHFLRTISVVAFVRYFTVTTNIST